MFERPSPGVVGFPMNTATLRRRLLHLWKKEIRPLLILALVLFSLRSSLADWNDVPTGSMKPTILEGDRVLVNKLAYDLKVPFTTWHLAEWSNPRRGDIVVFYSPHDGQRLVKRVIGLPGDRVELRDERLFLNGEPVAYGPLAGEVPERLGGLERASAVFASEHLAERSHAVMALPGIQAKRTFGPDRVPEGQYFVLGDNRDNSFDSRYWGCVPRQSILGRASTVVLSLDRDHCWLPRWSRTCQPLDP
jgi:signal peptidase I